MPETQRPNALELRKQLLLLESELNRASLRENLLRIRESAGHWNPLSILGPGDRSGSWWMKAAPVAGLIASSAAVPGPGWIRGGLRFVQLAAAAYPIWKAFSARKKPAPGE